MDGELVVPRPGLYYVYAQTYFRYSHSLEEEEEAGEEGEEAEGRGRPLLQYVYKKVRGAWGSSHPPGGDPDVSEPPRRGNFGSKVKAAVMPLMFPSPTR